MSDEEIRAGAGNEVRKPASAVEQPAASVPDPAAAPGDALADRAEDAGRSDVGEDVALPPVRPPLPERAREEMRELMARYPVARSALLPMLHLVQSYQGYVTPEGIEMCADELGLTEAEVAGVATFYTMFKRRPMGEYHVGVCTNTLCAVMGGDAIYAELSDHLGIGNNETTEDGKVSLERIECNAACDFAPVVMVNWEFFDNQTPQGAREVVDRLRAGEEVRSTRGPRVCTWKESARVLAGYRDDRANQGPQAGPATLAGLRLAKERGWSAPSPNGQGSHQTSDEEGK